MKPKTFTELDIAIMASKVQYCPVSGKLERVPAGTRWDNARVGTDHKGGYISVVILHSGRSFRLLGHRLAWMLSNGPIPDGMQVDHINGDRKDNRLENLRLVSHTGNQQNQTRPHVSNVGSGIMGAHLEKRTWKYVARIKDNGKSIHLGTFKTAEAAHAAYVAAKRRLHPTGTL